MKMLSVCLALSLVLLASACGSVEPWVKPYEREALADPLMALSRDPISDKHMAHVYETREGARGASGATGGGCGCN